MTQTNMLEKMATVGLFQPSDTDIITKSLLNMARLLVKISKLRWRLIKVLEDLYSQLYLQRQKQWWITRQLLVDLTLSMASLCLLLRSLRQETVFLQLMILKFNLKSLFLYFLCKNCTSLLLLDEVLHKWWRNEEEAPYRVQGISKEVLKLSPAFWIQLMQGQSI